MKAGGPDIAWVDTIDVCHLRCGTCIRGVRGLQNTTGKMSLELFGRIADRLREQGFKRIGLYNWTEPFLNPSIERFVARGKAAGFWVALSTTFSLPKIPNLEASLLAGLDLLTVSVSGFDQKTYEINHVGGVWDQVTANLYRLREIINRHPVRAHIDLRFLKFPYNAHQEPLLRDFARELGIHFEVVEATGNPEPGAQIFPTNDDLVRGGEQAAGLRSPEDEGKACELMFNQMAIDYAGNVFLCCAMPNYQAVRLGNFLEMSADEILFTKFTHPTCRGCNLPRRDRSKQDAQRLEAAFRSAPVKPAAAVAR
jgi:MoaA/NifB/PqqE/SkfB family radical SAM enzyme